jgi:hypothetical protein
MVKHFQDDEFSVFVSFVLKDFLDCDSFSGFSNDSFEDNTK